MESSIAVLYHLHGRYHRVVPSCFLKWFRGGALVCSNRVVLCQKLGCCQRAHVCRTCVHMCKYLRTYVRTYM